MQLDERLRNHVDEVARPVALDEILDQAIGDDPGPNDAPVDTVVVALDQAPSVRQVPRRQLWFVAAAVGLIAMVGAVLAVANGSNDQQLVLTNQPLPTLPDMLDSAAWRKVDNPFPPLDENNATQVASVIVVGDVAWAVGFEWRVEVVGGQIEARKRGAIWRSTDGERWTPVDDDFGRLDIAGGSWAPAGNSLEHIVALGDGTLLAFGNTFRDSISPLAYRSTDNGASWDEFDMPLVGSDEAALVSVAVDGARLAALVVDQKDRTSHVLISTDAGRLWDRASDLPSGTALGTALTIVDERIVLLTEPAADAPNASIDSWLSADLGETWQPANQSPFAAGHIARASDGLVAASLEGSGLLDVMEGIVENAEGQLWLSADGAEWTLLEREHGSDHNDIAPQLFPHQDGVLAMTQWTTETEAGVSMTNVNTSTGETTELGLLPSATFIQMFVLNDTTYIIGSERSAALEEVDEDAAIWVAE